MALALGQREGPVEAVGDDYNVYPPLVNAFAALGDPEASRKMREMAVAELERTVAG